MKTSARLQRCMLLACCTAAVCLHSIQAVAQNRMPADMRRYALALLWTGPDAGNYDPPERDLLRREHYMMFDSLAAQGLLLADAQVIDHSPLRHIVLLDADSAGAVEPRLRQDPLVRHGLLRLEPLTWWALKGLGGPDSLHRAPHNARSLPIESLQIGILSRGPKWTATRTPEIDSLLAGHMAHIRKMADSQRLIVAGPFEQSGERAGVFVFRCESVEEAARMGEEDPSVKAGRFRLDMYPLKVREGLFSKPGVGK